MSQAIPTIQINSIRHQNNQIFRDFSLKPNKNLSNHLNQTHQNHQNYLQCVSHQNEQPDQQRKPRFGEENMYYKVVVRKTNEVLELISISIECKQALEGVQFSQQKIETGQHIQVGIAYKRLSQLTCFGNSAFLRKTPKQFLICDDNVSHRMSHLNLEFFLLVLHQKMPFRSNKIKFKNDNIIQLQNQFNNHGYISEGYSCLSDINKKFLGSKNAQGNQYAIAKAGQFHDNLFGNLNQRLRKQNIFSLKPIWDSELKHKLKDIRKNWKVYEHSLREDLTTFTKLNMFKAFKLNYYFGIFKNGSHQMNNQINLYEKIYPGMTEFIDFSSKKLGIQSMASCLKRMHKNNGGKGKNVALNISNILNRSDAQQNENYEEQLEILQVQLQIKVHNTDRIFYGLLLQQNTNQQDKFINALQNQNNSHWTHLISTFINRSQSKKHIKLFQNIENQKLVEISCLGCSKFFIQNQNIYDESVNRTPVKVFSSIRKLKQIEATIKDEICGMLNSGGGIILFDCAKYNKGIYPEGIQMTQKDKQQYEQRVYSYVTQFYPKIQVKTHIHITFVPIVVYDHNNDSCTMKKYQGQEGILKQNYLYSDRGYCRGLFVSRIKIVPADPSLLYFWFLPTTTTSQPEYRYYCQTKNHDGTASIHKIGQLSQLIKKKMKQFYIKQSFTDEARRLLLNPSSFFNHECPEPEQGITIAQSNNSKAVQIKKNQPEELYNYLTLLVAKKDNHPEIKENLRKNRINVHIQILFPEFKIAESTAAMFHNNKFQQIYREINNNHKYSFHGKQVIVINVTSFLKLEKENQQPIYEDEFNEISNAFSKKFPNQTLKAYKFRAINPQKLEYYFLTETKKSNLYLYYLINNRNKKIDNKKYEKAVFKNPYLLDKLSQAEREERMILMYQKKGRNEISFNQSNPINLHETSTFQRNISTCESKGDAINETTSKEDSEETICRQNKVKITQLYAKNDCAARQDEYLYENWQQLNETYNYLIEINHKSLNSQDL